MTGSFEGLDNAMKLLIEQGEAKCHSEEANSLRTMEINGVMHQRYNERWVPMPAEIPDDEPVPEPMKFFTLQGVVDYINLNTEHLIPNDGEKLILQVLDETTVVLYSKPSKFHKDRYAIVRADAHVPGIGFERYMNADAFCTMLLSKFVDTDARRTLFSVVKSMTKEQSANTTDDGVGQQITVKAGVSLATNVTFQNPVPLKPRRTFTEVEQPESNFTLRVNENADAALFESDGGQWKNVAVENIKNFLKDNITNPAVVVIA